MEKEMEREIMLDEILINLNFSKLFLIRCCSATERAKIPEREKKSFEIYVAA